MRKVWCLNWMPEFSVMPFLASLMQSVGEGGLKKRRRKFSMSGQSPAPRVGLRIEYKCAQGLTLNDCGESNHLVLESCPLQIGRLRPSQSSCIGNP